MGRWFTTLRPSGCQTRGAGPNIPAVIDRTHPDSARRPTGWPLKLAKTITDLPWRKQRAYSVHGGFMGVGTAKITLGLLRVLSRVRHRPATMCPRFPRSDLPRSSSEPPTSPHHPPFVPACQPVKVDTVPHPLLPPAIRQDRPGDMGKLVAF